MAFRSFEAKVNLGIYITLGLFIPVIAFAAYSIHFIVSEQRDLVGAEGQQLILAERLRSELRTQYALMPAFVLDPRRDLVRHIKESQRRFRQTVDEISQMKISDEDRLLVTTIKKEKEELYQRGKPLIERRLGGESAEAVNKSLEASARSLSAELATRMDQYVDKKTDDLAETKAAVVRSIANLLRTLALTTMICLAFAGTIALLITKLTNQKRRLDLETQSRLNEQERFARARKEILEVVSHDLKNPLSTMKMATEILEDELSVTESAGNAQNREQNRERNETLEIAKRSIQSMERLIKDLLDNAKIESGNLSLEYSSARLHALTCQLSEPFKTLAKAKNIEVITRLENDDVDVTCDRDRMAQVFSNLIGNAIKFTPENGKIWISAEHKKDEALISIRDSGTGIPEEQLPHIFDRFWQVRATAAQGTGLGLAIVKGILDAHGAKIWAESEPGRGTKFCFTLPLRHQVSGSC